MGAKQILPKYTLTERGSQFIKSINVGLYSETASIVLKEPLNAKVKVTGIRGGVAEFTWEYIGLPSMVKRYVVRGGMGTAGFTLYDDGWRLTSLHYDYSDEPDPLTDKERAEDEKETQKWVDEQIALKEQERKRQEEEQERLRAEQKRLVELQFTDNGDGTVTENKTRLMWTKDANLFHKELS